MRRPVLRFSMALVAALTAFAAAFAQLQTHARSNADDSLKTFLQEYLRALHSDDEAVKYSAAPVDLNGDGVKEIIVYVTGPSTCGSGGCITLILARKGSSYRVVTEITITRPPIRVLPGLSRGWHNISVWVRGGGILPGYEAELEFNGETYPSNPTLPPARRLDQKVAGQVVIAASQSGEFLYP